MQVEWVPGHVGIWENELVDDDAKCGSYEEEDREVGELLMWGEWECRRKERERRSWKEFWISERKGEEYFRSRAGGELGHDGMRWVSRMLVWLRTNHGVMSGSRYFEERGVCECGEREDRDHYLIYCGKWDKWREEIWKDWDKGSYWDEGWVDMASLLFDAEGVKRVVEMGVKSGWKDRKWKGGRWSKKCEKEGMIWKPIKEELSGWVGGMGEERRRREAGLRKERKRRYKLRLKNGLVKVRTQDITPIASIIPGVGLERDKKLILKEVRIDVGRKVLGELNGNVVGRGGIGKRSREKVVDGKRV